MIADAPMVVYRNGEKKHTKKEMDKLVERYKKRHGPDYDGRFKGEKVDLNGFIRNDVGLKQR